ncbi:progranulin-like isoform X2 [Lineus longissimus]|uniref:progranulin-like isoform X2 n=1 Tax=Lineus longissimus TaxID=88925 RepID=UPI002B4D2869
MKMWGLFLTTILLVIGAQAGPLYFQPHDFSPDKYSKEIVNSGQPLDKTLCPGGRLSCPNSNTCCKLASGEWGCCPMRGSVICPDNESECPDGYTCCRLDGDDKYGCCPLPMAVCCSDGTHCCPSGYTCDVSAGTCTKGHIMLPWVKKVKAVVKSVICPDGQSECPSGNTCCKLSSGQYGCCPLQRAVCCSDGTHCCPAGYTCDVSSGTCSKGAEKIAWLEKAMATVKNVVCPDGQSECPTGNTCCKLSSGQYGCCPLPKAVCCSDGTHCCPSGYTCDVSSGTCSKGAEKIAWLKKAMATVKNVVCPDGQSECPTGSTCCHLNNGQYGCCPFPKAVCCSDGTHCCPSGYTCDVSSGTCSKGAEKIVLIKKVSDTVKLVICPDGQSECPDGNTCCKLSSGQYGCCPLPKAVCCSDGTHCCPSGYTCVVSSGTCSKGAEKIAWLKKAIATVKNVVCPDGQSECPSGNTCCKLSSGQYGCCPLPKAVCCSDGTHCCPSGYTCDVSSGTCSKGAEKIAWLKKTMATVKNVVCPDGQSECPSGNTCCKLSSGQYGCCPLPRAVCCSDGTHCCPSGYTCDVSSGTCSKGAEKIAWLKKTMATVKNVVCPDGQSECPSGNTCCKLSSGQYGCCPLPKAVCCSDGTHCCPSGYTCDVSSGACSKGAEKIAWLKKTMATVKNVVCPDGQSECPSGNTCCKLSSGQYGCCPLPKAVCCSDGTHCCPSGYTCDVSSGACSKGAEKIAWLQKKPAVVKVKEVVCPDQQSECPDGSTCCKLSSGEYGCCPLPNAVCCSDGVHCCPNGYTCDSSAGTCAKGAILISWMKKTVAKVALPPRITCPDERWSCGDGTTCCKMSDGGYGCCPVINAVCCDDHIHCCPHHTTCDTKLERCVAGDGSSQPWSKKAKAENAMSAAPAAEGNVMCPDGISYCLSGQTCCKTAMGRWACCPLPKAVCCSDHIHCCPNGYSCNSGQCNRGMLEMPLMKKVKAVLRKDHDCGGNITCIQENTCCMMKTGAMGCCPIPNAVCCQDGLHCCPSGMMCGKGDKKCVKKDGAVDESFPLKNKHDRDML